MMFSCDTADLKSALAIATRVVDPRSPYPILANLKLVTNNTRVTVIGSNADVTFEVDVPANVETEGVICIPSGALAKFVGAVRSDQVRIAEDGGKAKVTSGRNRISLICANVDDYPNYRATEGDMATLDAKTICRAMRYCDAAASTEEVRYYLCGVFFDEHDTDLNLWGTNGHIASRAVMKDVATVGGGAILPSVAVKLILTIAAKADTMGLNVNGRGWSAQVGNTRIWGKVIDGSFPDMRAMLNQFSDWTDAATIEMDRVRQGLTIGAVGSDTMSDKASKVILKSLGEDAIIFRGGNPGNGVGEAGRAEVDASVKSDFAVALNAKYLAAALTGIDDDGKLTIRHCNGPGIQIEPSQPSITAQMTSVVIPMRVSQEELDDV